MRHTFLHEVMLAFPPSRLNYDLQYPFNIPSANMENEQRVFLAYRAIFEGNNAQIRQPKAILKVLANNRQFTRTLLKSLGEKHVVDTLKSLLERKVFQSELEAKLAFPDLFTTSLAQDVQHNASEADAARSEAEALEDVASLEGDGDDAMEGVDNKVSSVILDCELGFSLIDIN